MSGTTDLPPLPNPAPTQSTQRTTRLPLGRSNRRLSFERRLRIWLTVLSLPTIVLAFVAAYTKSTSLTIALVAALGCAAVWAIACSSLFDQIVRPMQTLSNVVAALREDDFSFRARGGRRGDAIGDLALEINALASTLQQQRSSASDAITLVERVLTTMQSPVLAFDQEQRLRLINAAAESAFSLPRMGSIGSGAANLNLAALFEVPDGAIYAPSATSINAPRWTVARTAFRLNGLPHTLLVLSDVAAVLRDEERSAWQRIIRVLSHEINNSLTPIQSIAGSLRVRLVQSSVPPSDPTDFLRGLTIIEERSASLNRFLQAYQRLLRLPPPAFRLTALGDLIEHIAQLETRLPIRIHPGPDLLLQCDPDQIQQALINLIQNATDAVLSPGLPQDPCVQLSWTTSPGEVIISLEDNGVGIGNFTNLFVPFYTTKPNGSGIGLVLAQQIAQAHGGRIALFSRHNHPGTLVEMRLSHNRSKSLSSDISD